MKGLFLEIVFVEYSRQKHAIWIMHSKDRFTHARQLFRESEIYVFQLNNLARR